MNNLFEKYITQKNIAFFLVLLLFLVFVYKFKNLAILFFAAFVISCSLSPVVDKLSAKMNRGLATGLTLITTLILIFSFFIPIIVLSGNEIKPFFDNMPQYLDNFKTFIVSIPFLDKSSIAQVDIGDFVSSASGVTTQFLNESINVSKNIASAFVYFFAALIIIYYFLSDKETINNTYLKLFPQSMKEKATAIKDSVSKKVGGYVIAQIATMTSVGVLMTIGLLVMKVDYAILLGLITAILDIIPIVGPAIALILCLLISYKSGLIVMLIVTLLFLFVQWAENSLLRPYLFGKFLDLHPLIVYLFLFLTAQVLGVVGVIFAPAIAATFCVLLEELYIKNIE